MSFFSEYLTRTDHRSLSKWRHYFKVYERELSRFRTRPIRFLEIGIWKGGSIPMWKEFFADGSHLVFIDIDPECKAHQQDGTHVEIGNQADPTFLRELIEKHGPFDVVLDDGSHVCEHQVATFQHLWPHISDDGIYMVEDIHTSYWPGFGGGYRNEASFVEFAKRKVDAMHSWYTDQDAMFAKDPIAEELSAVRFYDSIVVMEKDLKEGEPLSLTAHDGKVWGSRKGLEVRGRRSVFAGKDGRS